MTTHDFTTHTYRDDAPTQRVTPRALRRAIILAPIALAALCGAVVAVAAMAGTWGAVAQFGGCLAVGLAVVAAAKRGRG